ncbi:MAG: hypothetical protein U0514_01600 [Candidatus Andersenbacteria bacterium]
MTSPSEHEPLRPERGPASTPAAAEAPTDAKIRELEVQLERLRGLKAGGQAEQLRVLQSESGELLEHHKEQEQYVALQRQLKESAAGPGPGSSEAAAAAAANQVSAAALLGSDPQAAVAALVQLATANAAGFERAVRLVKEAAPHPGGAWILDEFHKRMVKGAGGAPSSAATET